MFRWDYDKRIGQFQSLNFYKSLPHWQAILDKNGNNSPEHFLQRAELIKNKTYWFALKNATMSDNGTYSIDIYYGLPLDLLLLADTAELIVVLSSGKC